MGMKLAIADIDAARLEKVGKELKAMVGDQNVLVIPTDVSKLDEVVSFRDKVYENWGEVRSSRNLPSYCTKRAGFLHLPLQYLPHVRSLC